MSKINGDKARFHVARKQNIKRRAKMRALLLSLAGSSGKKATGSKATSGKSAE